MSLYGDLPSAKDDDAGGKGWVAAAQKLQPTWKKPAGVLAPPSVTRGGRGGGRTPSAAGRGGGRGQLHAAAAGVVNIHASPAGATAQHHQQHQQRGSTFSFFTSVTGEQLADEYDPSKPNDYEEIVKQRQKKQREAEEETERLARMREMQQEIDRRKQEQAEAAAFIAAASRPPPGAPEHQQQQQQQQPAAGKDDDDPDAEFAYQGPMGGLGSSSSGGAAAAAAMAAAAGLGSSSGGAPPDAELDEYEQERQRRLKMSGDDAFKARGRIGGAGPPPSSSSSSSFGGLPGLSGPAAAAAAAAAAPMFMQQQQQQQQQQQPGGGKGMGLAQKLLEKMGWREGQGLGRHRQGMSTPLVAQKTASNAGVIVNADQGGEQRARLGSAFVGVPCRVVVLRNMVGPGEVDEDLEEEVGTELTKYGTVTDVMIFEVTTPGYPPEEAVRIFVQFDRTESATRALVDIQGRFFGGRQVRAAFFSEERFEKQQLAPQAGEFGEGS